MTAEDDREARLDLRLVPAALTSWAVTAAGILWSISGVVGVLSAAVAVRLARRGGVVADRGYASRCADDGGGCRRIALIGLGFAVAVQLRVDQVRHHPIVDRYGAVVAVVVTPSETPRSLRRRQADVPRIATDSRQRRDAGRVVVFASDVGFAELTAGRPAAFKARIARPSRRDLTVAVLSATGRPTLGEAAPIQRAGQRVASTSPTAARAALPPDQAAMLPALVLGDTSTLAAETTAQFRASGLTHLTAVSGANVTIVCGAVLLTAALVGPRVAVALAAVALLAFVIVVQPSASVLRAAVMGAITLLAVVSHRRRQAIPVLSASVVALMIGARTRRRYRFRAVGVGDRRAGRHRPAGRNAWSARLAQTVADAVSVAVAAQLVTAPLVAAISGTFSVVAVAANLSAAAVIPPITVIGTAAAALTVLWPAAAVC